MPHRAELDHVEELVPPAQTALHEQHRPAIFQLDEQRHHQQQRRKRQQGKGRHRDIEHALQDARAQAQRPGRDHQRRPVELVITVHPDRAEAVRRLAHDLAINARALEQEGPVLAAFTRAAHHHLILVAQQLAQPVEHEGIVAGRIEVVIRGGNAVGPVEEEIRSAIVDHQPVGHPPLPAPVDKHPDHAPADRQQQRGQQQPERHHPAREILVRLGVEGDEVDEARRQGQRDQRLARGEDPVPQGMHAVGLVIEREREINRQHRLRGDHRAAFSPFAFPDRTRERKADVEQRRIDQQHQDIGAQTPPLQRRHDTAFHGFVANCLKQSRRSAVH